MPINPLIANCQLAINPLIANPNKMVKHIQTIRRLLPTNGLGVFDNFVGLPLKGLTLVPYVTFLHPLKTSENYRFFDVFRGYKNEYQNRVFLRIYLHGTKLLELSVKPRPSTSQILIFIQPSSKRLHDAHFEVQQEWSPSSTFVWELFKKFRARNFKNTSLFGFWSQLSWKCFSKFFLAYTAIGLLKSFLTHTWCLRDLVLSLQFKNREKHPWSYFQ